MVFPCFNKVLLLFLFAVPEYINYQSLFWEKTLFEKWLSSLVPRLSLLLYTLQLPESYNPNTLALARHGILQWTPPCYAVHGISFKPGNCSIKLQRCLLPFSVGGSFPVRSESIKVSVEAYHLVGRFKSGNSSWMKGQQRKWQLQ